jgi:GNAT superfamily N-acetyltransferase
LNATPDVAQVIPLPPALHREAAEVLTRALFDYPTMCWICRRERPGYERRLRAAYRLAIDVQRAEDQPILGILHRDRVAAAALVHEPGRRITLRAALVGLTGSLLSPARSTIRRGHRFDTQVERLRPDAPHHFLSVIGVTPALQRRGYGRALMLHLHARSEGDTRSAGVALDTSDPANVVYYGAMGYEVTECARFGSVEQAILFRPSRRTG